MPEIIFSKKEFQIWDFESLIFWSIFVFQGTALGRFSQCFLKFLSSANHGGRHFYSAPLPPPLKSFLRPWSLKGSCKPGKSDKWGVLLLLSLESVSISGSRFPVPASRLFFAFLDLMNSSSHCMSWRLSNLDYSLATASDDVPDLLSYFISFFARAYLSRNRLKSFSASSP